MQMFNRRSAENEIYGSFRHTKSFAAISCDAFVEIVIEFELFEFRIDSDQSKAT